MTNNLKREHFIKSVIRDYGFVIKNQSYHDLSKEYGIYPEKARRWIKQLEKQGLLKIENLSVYKRKIVINRDNFSYLK